MSSPICKMLLSHTLLFTVKPGGRKELHANSAQTAVGFSLLDGGVPIKLHVLDVVYPSYI